MNFKDICHEEPEGPLEVTGVVRHENSKGGLIPCSIFNFQRSILLKGIYSDGDPPLPIPNREVKPVSADGTARGWESRSMPNLERASSSDSLFFYI